MVSFDCVGSYAMTVIGTCVCVDRGANDCTLSVDCGISAHDEQKVIIPIAMHRMRVIFLFFIIRCLRVNSDFNKCTI